MTTDRKFAAFDPSAPPFRMRTIPEGGLCLSAFVVLSPVGQPTRVLMGRLHPSAPWDHLGALDAERAARHSRGWMLPSSHLLVKESPQAAARRVLQEQLGLEEQPLNGPVVVSEAYVPRIGVHEHWDIEFIFTGERSAEVPRTSAWRELRFIDLTQVRREDMARSHEDILGHVGRWRPAS